MKKIYTSIDLGSYGIKMIVSECINGAFHVLAATNVRSKGIKNGIITDLESAIVSLQKAKKDIEEMIGVSINQAIVSVPSDKIEFSIVTGETALNPETMIDTPEISKVLHEAILGNIKEERELVTIMPISFHVDDKDGIKDPKGMMGQKLLVKAVIATVPKPLLKETLILLKTCEITPVDVCLKAVGDYFEAKTPEIDDKVGAIINLGYDNVEVSIFNKGIMIKNEKIEMGSKVIDLEIMKRYFVKRGVARSLKENFAISNTRYADASDYVEVMNKNQEKVKIGQLEISELVENKIVELLKLAKKQINLLTNREISYIIITGGISELAGFQYVVENVFDRRATTLDITTMGVRNNMYSSAFGMIKYFYYKLESRGKTYSMFNESQAEDLVSTNGKVSGTTNDSIIQKVFGYFS